MAQAWTAASLALLAVMTVHNPFAPAFKPQITEPQDISSFFVVGKSVCNVQTGETMFKRLIPEKRPHKIAAIFDQQNKAMEAEETLVDYGHFDQRDVKLIYPQDEHAAEKLEPETREIGATLFSSHLILGAAGTVIGLVAATLVSLFGPTFAQSSPYLLHLALGMVGLFFGLFVAGAVTLRPDHDPLINETLDASRQSFWAVIVQARDRGDQQRARQLLMPAAISVTDTF